MIMVVYELPIAFNADFSSRLYLIFCAVYHFSLIGIGLLLHETIDVADQYRAVKDHTSISNKPSRIVCN